MRTPLRSLFLSLAAFTALTAHAQVSLDFETAGQLTDNFRNLGPSNPINTQSSNGVANDYIIHNVPDASVTAAALLYDTTPGDTTTGTQSTFSVSSPLKIDFDFRATTAGSSIGIIFADSTNASNNMLALFNIDNTGTTDLVRFFKDGTVTSASVTAGLQSGSNQTASTGVDIGSAFGHYSVTLSVTGTSPSLTLTVGSQTFSNVPVSGDFDWANTTVILRIFDTGGSAANTTVDVDNFTINSIPEPSTYAAFFGTSVLGLALLRRRPKA
ncbi:PEP-CTERM sorting domain-containing protein [Rariglobus hedericola]|nr:PEP-CTERM sorting domain-containing protein [Rariglobus hedericola]